MKLNRADREENRKKYEKISNQVPDGVRIHIDKELLEELLFENLVIAQDSIKIPIWSGPFLRKIDLSEVNFDNVEWGIIRWDTIQLLFECYLRHEMSEEDFEYFVKKFSDLGKKEAPYYIDYSNTNANIILKKAPHSGFIVIQSANFYGIDLSYLDNSDILAIRAVDSNFEKTGLKLSSDVCFEKQFRDCSFENLELSDVTIDAKNIVNHNLPFGDNNFARTNLNIIYHSEDFPRGSAQRSCLAYMLKNGYLDGCYINGKIIHSLEERKKLAQEQMAKYLKMKNDFLTAVTKNIEDQARKMNHR